MAKDIRTQSTSQNSISTSPNLDIGMFICCMFFSNVFVSCFLMESFPQTSENQTKPLGSVHLGGELFWSRFWQPCGSHFEGLWAPKCVCIFFVAGLPFSCNTNTIGKPIKDAGTFEKGIHRMLFFEKLCCLLIQTRGTLLGCQIG